VCKWHIKSFFFAFALFVPSRYHLHMSTDTLSPFLTLARQLCDRTISESHLPDKTRPLPPLNRTSVDMLAAESTAALLVEPRYGWTIGAVMVAAVQHIHDPFLHALTHFYLARAANGYYRPKQVAIAAAQARESFVALGEEGWTAVCDWQANAIPWMRPNFTEAAATLEAALPIIDTHHPQFTPDCRLSLAYAYLLVDRIEEMTAQIEAAKATFTATDNQLGLAHCLYVEAAYQRRFSQFPAAWANLRQALMLYTTESTTVFITIVQYNLAYMIRDVTGNTVAAIEMFQKKAAQFGALDLPLWQAQCQTGLARSYNSTGQPMQAEKMYEQAGEVYVTYELIGLQADNAMEHGLLVRDQGRYDESLAHFHKASLLYDAVGRGRAHLQILLLMNQGYVYYLQGAYSQALHLLEKAYSAFKTIAIAHRSAGCAYRLGLVWVKLAHFERAQQYLDEAIALYKSCEKEEGLPALYMLQAEIAYRQQHEKEATDWLQQALTLATAHGALSLMAQTHQLLATHLLEDGAWAMAEEHLQTAVSHFTKLGMITEQAACSLVLGRVYAGLAQPQAARSAWQQASALSDITEIRWQAEMELAHHASQQQTATEALRHYRAGVTALTEQRRQLWQPTLAGAYLQHTVLHMDRAIALAFQEEDRTAALQFVEESKAQTVMQKLVQPTQAIAALPEAMQKLVLEIRWLQKRLNQARQVNVLTRLSLSDLQTQFMEKVQRYQTAMGKLERTPAPHEQSGLWGSFTLAAFRQMAIRRLDSNWVALDYYVTETAVYTLIITPHKMELHTTKMNGRLHDALRTCIQRQCRHPRAHQALTLLGDALLPPSLWTQLNVDTTLIISPHGSLHQLPWAGLRSATGGWLVETAVPVIVPSLHSAIHLWQRPVVTRNDHASGLLVTVADFEGRYASLPAVTEEREGLLELLNTTPQLLTNEAATVASLQEQAQMDEWEKRPFLHIATHAFTDQVTGRLSGIALHDRDLWLNEWQQLAPLPPLVTFSACSGLRSRVYTGDEAIGLPTTCLAAGAQQVMGSLWTLLDATTPRFMQAFYTHWQKGESAARALALAQRAAVQDGSAILQWAGYQCIGV